MKVVSGLCLSLLVFLVFSGLAQERKEKRPERTVRTDEATARSDRNKEKSRPLNERGSPRGESHHSQETSRVKVLSPAPTIKQIPKRTQVEDQSAASQARNDDRSIFNSVQEGITTGNIGVFSRHMDAQVYVNLRGGESGYYSANQAYYLLEDYFKARKLVSFDFTTVGETETNPYATGRAAFNVKGSRENAQVYVSLSLSQDRWVITQIKIY